MLVEESSSLQLSYEVEELVKSLQSNSQTSVLKHDLIMCVLCALMKECDFQFYITQAECIKTDSNIYTNVSKVWKNTSTNHYNLTFVLGHFIKHRCRLIGIPSKDALIINVVISGLSNQCYSTSILCTDYVSIEEIDSNNMASMFHNLKDLSLKFKNSIGHPVRSAILNEEGIVNASLMGIPYELQIKIFKYLSIKELGNTAQTSQYFNYLCNDQGLWKSVALKIMSKNDLSIMNLKMKEHNIENPDWKQECKEALKRRHTVFQMYDRRRYQRVFYF